MAVQMRPGQALRLWHDVSLALVRDAEPDLSVRQITRPDHRLSRAAAAHGAGARGEARRDQAGDHARARHDGAAGPVTRKRDPADRRNVLVQRTVNGALFLERLGDLVAAKAAALPA